MDNKIIIVSTLIILELTFFVFMMIRISRVSAYLKELLNKVSLYSKKDIKKHKPWMWRFLYIKRVSFTEMVWRFWRSLDSFYPDKSFIKE